MANAFFVQCDVYLGTRTESFRSFIGRSTKFLADFCNQITFRVNLKIERDQIESTLDTYFHVYEFMKFYTEMKTINKKNWFPNYGY